MRNVSWERIDYAASAQLNTKINKQAYLVFEKGFV